MLYQKQTIAGEKNSVSAVSDFQWVAMTFLEEDEEWLNLLTTHLFLPVIALVGILQVWLYFIFFNATLPHTNEYNGKIGKCKGYDCQALILPKPKISLSALEKHLHCLAGPFQVFRILLRFRCIPFSYQSSPVDKSIEKVIGKWIYFVYPKIMMPCLKWHLVHKGMLRKSANNLWVFFLVFFLVVSLVFSEGFYLVFSQNYVTDDYDIPVTNDYYVTVDCKNTFG